MIEELARHGYRISPGSLYPLLQGLEKKGYLRSTECTEPLRWAERPSASKSKVEGD
jgi:DNA-binding PadR family transcriptional regulator